MKTDRLQFKRLVDKLQAVGNLTYKEAEEMIGINKRTLVKGKTELEAKQL